MAPATLASVPPLIPALEDAYRDLHSHPELSRQEQRTAGIVAASLRSAAFDVTEGVGGYGVVGVLHNGDGPTVWLRADMDALPVLEETGLDYASTVVSHKDDGDEVPVMHACGHDMHTTCLMGATTAFANSRDSWSGTLVAIFQPDEETLHGSGAMIDDGVLDRFPRPDVVLGQHVGPLPAGTVFYLPGAIMAGADNLEIRLFGAGGHGSMPQTTVDPVVMAASLVLRLQTIVSREVAPNKSVVVTIGSVTSGKQDNIIPSEALLKMTVRTFDTDTRNQVLAAIERITKAEALASNSPRDPEITITTSGPSTINDAAATGQVVASLQAAWGPTRVFLMPEPATGSEDVGRFGTTAGVPSVFWFLGGAEPTQFLPPADPIQVMSSLPSNHSSKYAPDIEPTLQTGVEALIIAASTWLAPAAAG